MDWLKLKFLLADQPSFRYKQAVTAICCELIEQWGQATSLPVVLRTKLEQELDLTLPAKLQTSREADKALLTLADGLAVETVLMKHRDGRRTVCVSSQVGCPLKCSFCATGDWGFKRNLNWGEIVNQVLYWQRRLKLSGDRVSNLVFMGMGEPLLNTEAVFEAVRFLNDPAYFGIGARHISISTAGIVPGIQALSDLGLQLNLAISLHAPDDELRNRLMPINRHYDLSTVLKAVNDYVASSGRQVMFEYLLLDGINDSPAQARQLAKLLNQPLYMVNLLTYNSAAGAFRPSPQTKVKQFKEILTAAGLRVTERHSLAASIDGACGQLAKSLASHKN